MFTYCITGVVAAVGISESSLKQECPECKFVLSPKPAIDGDIQLGSSGDPDKGDPVGCWPVRRQYPAAFTRLGGLPAVS